MFLLYYYIISHSYVYDGVIYSVYFTYRSEKTPNNDCLRFQMQVYNLLRLLHWPHSCVF